MKIAFIHPDLGIGGAERLVVDAAVGLQSLGHEVTIFTSRCDRDHCFEEVQNGTVKVIVKGDNVVPRTVFGKFYIACAILRQLHLTAYLLTRENATFDAIFVDQLAFCVPILKAGLEWWPKSLSSSSSSPSPSSNAVTTLQSQSLHHNNQRKRKVKILFYCHFPDKLLAIRQSLIKKLYRLPFDALEAFSTARADVILVNSRFTQRVFRQAFPGIHKTPGIVYPCVTPASAADVDHEFVNAIVGAGKLTIVSVNRFERKKSVELAIRAYAALNHDKSFNRTVMLVAGGYDAQVPENVEYLTELQQACDNLGLNHATVFNVGGHSEASSSSSSSSNKLDKFTAALTAGDKPNNVIFLPSVSTAFKNAALRTSRLLTYTPTNEHFGIVPLEAMLQCVPVLATASGGPLETVDDEVNGWLRPADPTAWTPVISRVLFDMDEDQIRKFGTRGRDMVLRKFTRNEMATSIERAFLSSMMTSSLSSSSLTGSDYRTENNNDDHDYHQPAIMRTPGWRDALWLVALSWMAYYCKYGFAFIAPGCSEILVGIGIVLVVYYAFF
ncbi:hypothetical protein V1514DRAFT_331882 [Lipomyces japonicus]|uniref:uncharacterized protein n=1 Tax=Lipomyces japonicus TaxID=56871 RepID=UPI0034CE3EAE